MKRVLTLCLLFFVAMFPSPVFAHSTIFPPFFLVNGMQAPANPLQTNNVTSSSIPLTQDLSPGKYLVGQPIDLKIDQSVLETILDPSAVQQASFNWDFGDNTKGAGLENNHTYKNPGSYNLFILADFHQPNLGQLLIESVQIDVVPTLDYQLPKAIIFVNELNKSGYKNNSLPLDLNKSLSFDISKSENGFAKIVDYTLDYGDGQTSKNLTSSHRYRLPLYFVSPVVQVKDENNLVSTAFINLSNSGKNDPNNPQREELINVILITSLAIAVIIGVAVFIYFRNAKNE